MRKTLSGLCAVLSITAGVLFAAPAHAANNTASGDDVHPMVWTHYAWLKTPEECDTVGERGRSKGWWRAFGCFPHPDVNLTDPWELTVDWN